MLRTLRSRFVVSHTLPIIAVVLTLGVSLLYALESQVLLSDLANEVRGQAVLAANLIRNQEDFWNSAARRELMVTSVHNTLDARVMLLDVDGRLLISSDSRDASRLGEVITTPGITAALSGQESVFSTYSQHMQAEVVDVAVPVYTPEGRMAGALRISHEMGTVYQRFVRLRYLIAFFLAGALGLSLVLGWAVANHMERPLRRVTQAIHELSLGRELPASAGSGAGGALDAGGVGQCAGGAAAGVRPVAATALGQPGARTGSSVGGAVGGDSGLTGGCRPGSDPAAAVVGRHGCRSGTSAPPARRLVRPV